MKALALLLSLLGPIACQPEAPPAADDLTAPGSVETDLAGVLDLGPAQDLLSDGLLPPISVQGGRFVAGGRPVQIQGAIICCTEPYAKQDGWPLIWEAAIDLLARHQINFTHIRLGPFTQAGEGGAEWVAYRDAGGGKVDLNTWNPLFWDRLRALIRHARQRGIYVEVDVFDNWLVKYPEIHAMSRQNNINGVDAGNSSVLARPPQPVHERWVRKIAAELGGEPNVLFQIGNEAFLHPNLSPDWERGLMAILRPTGRLVATNSGRADLEGEADYINRHAQEAQAAAGKPVLVNEYSSLPPAKVLEQVRRARALGTVFHYWRGEHDQTQWLSTLAALQAL